MLFISPPTTQYKGISFKGQPIGELLVSGWSGLTPLDSSGLYEMTKRKFSQPCEHWGSQSSPTLDLGWKGLSSSYLLKDYENQSLRTSHWQKWSSYRIRHGAWQERQQCQSIVGVSQPHLSLSFLQGKKYSCPDHLSCYSTITSGAGKYPESSMKMGILCRGSEIWVLIWICYPVGLAWI